MKKYAAFGPLPSAWCITTFQGMLLMRVRPVFVRAYLPFYNGNVVLKAELSCYKHVAGNTHAASVTCSKPDVCAAVAFTAVSSFRMCGDTCFFFFFLYLNTSVLAKGLTKEPANEVKQMKHLLIL